ncbi:MAG: hypothetical protein NC918_00815 [Candidatus Omnitrophica bacterium]|nr:hypothetical protein [Candidatus Omnitrophota bacterium]
MVNQKTEVEKNRSFLKRISEPILVGAVLAGIFLYFFQNKEKEDATKIVKHDTVYVFNKQDSINTKVVTKDHAYPLNKQDFSISSNKKEKTKKPKSKVFYKFGPEVKKGLERGTKKEYNNSFEHTSPSLTITPKDTTKSSSFSSPSQKNINQEKFQENKNQNQENQQQKQQTRKTIIEIIIKSTNQHQTRSLYKILR